MSVVVVYEKVHNITMIHTWAWQRHKIPSFITCQRKFLLVDAMFISKSCNLLKKNPCIAKKLKTCVPSLMNLNKLPDISCCHFITTKFVERVLVDSLIVHTYQTTHH